ncbi:MAG: PAS domain S-box protein [Chitinophagaceae bacterium]|nr:MAG: PAS domain S-box protein [Chitinophagaceae bacterium]
MNPTGDNINNDPGGALAAGQLPDATIDWRLLLDASKHAMILLDRNLNVVYMNAPGRAIFSLPPNFPAPGDNAFFPDMLPAERRERAMPVLGEALNGREMLYETPYTHPGGSPVWYELNYRPLVNSTGVTGHILISVTDITEFKKNELTISKNEQRWKFVVEGDGNGVWEMNFLTREAYFSDLYKSMLGYGPEDVYDSTIRWKELIHPDDHARVVNLETLYENKVITQHSIEYRIRKKDGGYVWVLNRGMVMESLPDGCPLRIAGTQKDITNTKNAEEALRQSEERYYQMIDSIEDYAIMMLDPNGNVLNWNKGAEKIKGYKPWEIIGKNFLSFYRKEEIAAGIPQWLLDTARSTGRAVNEGWRVKKDGSRFWASAIITLVKDRDGSILGFSKITRDLTDQKSAQDKLIKSEHQFSSFMANTPTMNWIIDENAVFRYLNDPYMKAFNLTPEHVGKSIYEIFPAQICDEFVANNWKVWISGKAIETYEEGVGPGGRKQFYHTYKFPLPTENGIRLLGGVSLDLTQQRVLESELANEEDKRKREVIVAIIEAQEKERKNLAYELHDNVNQILTSSRLMLEVAAEKPDSYNKFVNNGLMYLQSAIQEVRRISHSLTPGTLSDIGLEDALEEVVNDINKSGQLVALYKKRILFPTRNVPADVQLTILRIVQEQLRNIIKHSGSETAAVILKCTPQRISVRIEDDGNGFNPMTAKKGLGLNGIYNRTEFFNGKVILLSEPGKGCILIIHIPMA